MPFREKAKALFKTKSRNDSLSKSSTNGSDRERLPSNVYKPGETMPRPKYRAPPKKEHTEKLEAFSFSDAWGRKSYQSTYSPMGTRLSSRRNSWMSLGRKKSAASTVGTRSSSVKSVGTEKNGVRHRENMGAAQRTLLSTEVEAEGDDDVGNVGLSRVQSREKATFSRPQSAGNRTNGQPNGQPTGTTGRDFQPLGTAYDHQPFTEADLELALKRSHLTVPPAQG